MALTQDEIEVILKARDELSGVLDRVDAKTDRVAASTSRFGDVAKTAALGGVTVLAGAAVGAGVGLFKLGQNFDEAFDTISAKTGAVGPELEELQDTFRDVFTSVPTDMQSAAEATAAWAQVMGTTHPAVGSLAKASLQLSRITGTDLTKNIESTSRAMKNWNIDQEDASNFLDTLYVASQRTGVGVDRLADLMATGGVALRQLGFSTDQAVATLAKFEKEGVNTDAILASLKKALVTTAKDGEPAVETFQRVVAEIENAGSAGEANAKAIELFGAKAGTEMAAAIREGRFELGDLVGALADSEGAIDRTALATEDFGEKFTRLKNRAFVALEPAALGTISLLTELADTIETRVVPWLEEWWSEHQPQINAALEDFKQLMNEDVIPTLKSLLDTWNAIWPVLEPFVKLALENVISRVQTALELVLGIIRFVAAVLRGDWSEAWEALKDIAAVMWQAIQDEIAFRIELIKVSIRNLLPIMLSLGQQLIHLLWAGIQNAKDWFMGQLNSFIDGILERLDPRNWDIPGMSPVDHAYAESGKAWAKALQTGLKNGMRGFSGPEALLDSFRESPDRTRTIQATPTIQVFIDRNEMHGDAAAGFAALAAQYLGA